MGVYKPQEGDRVRVVLEGEVRYAHPAHFTVGERADVNAIAYEAKHLVSVEKLEPPVEVFGPGDIVRPKDNGHIVYMLGRNHYSYVCIGVGAGEVIRERLYDTERFTSRSYEKIDLG